jgi:hypothetical protein
VHGEWARAQLLLDPADRSPGIRIGQVHHEVDRSAAPVIALSRSFPRSGRGRTLTQFFMLITYAMSLRSPRISLDCSVELLPKENGNQAGHGG